MGVFNKTLKKYGLGSGEKFKVQEGKNVIRILSEPRVVQSVYQGQPNTKFLAWVLDRADGKIKFSTCRKPFWRPFQHSSKTSSLGSQGFRCPTT
jgi:hypothetical protein